jgi:hypothetical protein
MTISLRNTAVALASLLAIAAAPSVLRAADNTPLPGQLGADTSVGQQLRGGPYPWMLMMVTSDGKTFERQITESSAAELMKHAKPMGSTTVLMHEGKSYTIENVKMHNGKMLYDHIYDSLQLPQNLIFG